MANFERVEQAVNDKVNHLKNVAKLDDLATKLSDEFTAAKGKLQKEKESIPKLLKGFDAIQIHTITKNAEVKEEAAKKELATKIDGLIAMLKNPPEKQGETNEGNNHSGGSENSENNGGSSGGAGNDTKVEGKETPAAISPELNTALNKTIAQAIAIMNAFQPKDKQEALAKFGIIEEKLTELIGLAEKVEAALPAGADKTEISKLKQEFSEFKSGLIQNKATLEGLPDMMFPAAEGKLNEAKAQARQLIERFEGVVNRNNKATVAQESTTSSNTNNTTAQDTKDKAPEATDDKIIFDQVPESKTLSGYLRAVLNKKYATASDTMSLTIPVNFTLDQKNHWWFKNFSPERKEKDGITDMPFDKYISSGFENQRYGTEDGIHELTQELRKDGKAVHYKLEKGVLTIEKTTMPETASDPAIKTLLEHIFTYKDVARVQSGGKSMLKFSFPNRKEFEAIYSESAKADQPNIKMLREGLTKLGIQPKGMSFYMANNTLLIEV